STQTDCAGYVGRSRFEFVGQRVVLCLLESDGANHVAAALIGWHSFEQLVFPVQHTDSHWPIHLVARKGVEVAIEILDIDSDVGNSLCSIYYDGDVVCVRNLHNFPNWVNRSQRIGHMSDGHDLCARTDQLLELIQQQFTLIVDRDDAQLCPLLLAENLPRDDVGVMLHRADEHLVAGADVLAPVSLSYEIDALGRSTNEDEFFHSRSIDELAHGLSCCFVLSGGVLGKKVNAAVDISVSALVVARDGVDDRLRLLRRCCVIEINESLATDLLVQNRKVAAQAFDVKS